MSAAPQLELRGVTKRFGGVAAVDGVSFEIARGDIVGIIGPNGAGKTTLLNCISGVYHLDGGDIRLTGSSVVGLAPHRVARLGIGRTFQIVKPFGSMTARENVGIGALFGSAHAPRGVKQAFALADDVLALVGLAADHPVSRDHPRSQAARRSREVATAPRRCWTRMAGLNNVEIDEAPEMILVHATGVTKALIEHVMRDVGFSRQRSSDSGKVLPRASCRSCFAMSV